MKKFVTILTICCLVLSIFVCAGMLTPSAHMDMPMPDPGHVDHAFSLSLAIVPLIVLVLAAMAVIFDLSFVSLLTSELGYSFLQLFGLGHPPSLKLARAHNLRAPPYL